MNVFICYRREDSIEAAGRLYDRLVAQLSRDEVFKDVDTLPAGASFAQHIREVIRQSDVVLVLIGPRWLRRPSPFRAARLYDPADFVRVEIETALSAEARIIPVLVAGTTMPNPRLLPASLRSLCERHALSLRPDPDFHVDASRILRELAGATTVDAPEEPLRAVSRSYRAAPSGFRLQPPPPPPQVSHDFSAPPRKSRWKRRVMFALLLLILGSVLGSRWKGWPKLLTHLAELADQEPSSDGSTPGHALPIVNNSLGMTLVLIPSGEFMMGSTPLQVERLMADNPKYTQHKADTELPRHRVRISQPFYLGAHEVTRGQFLQFVRAANYETESLRDGQDCWGWNSETGKWELDPKYNWLSTGFTQDASHPVANVTWNDALAFCNWLSRAEGLPEFYRIAGGDVTIAGGSGYRLPTEAEWEYACRAGSEALYCFGDDDDGVALFGNVPDATSKAKWSNYPDNRYLSTDDGYAFSAPVGGFRPNFFGLFDMHGNCWEWCFDGFDPAAYKSRVAVMTSLKFLYQGL